MQHSLELNRIIAAAAKRPEFATKVAANFEKASPTELATDLNTENLFFTCSVMGMEAVSHVIEDQALTMGGNFRFYSGFQKLSRFKPQQARYLKLAELASPIFIFALADTDVSFKPNIRLVSLGNATKTDDLAHNWFVILDNPQFVSMALVARELPGLPRPDGAPDKLIYRNFEGFWTYDRAIISRVVNVLEDFITSRTYN